MKVLSAELVPANKRERIYGGVYIEFEASENVKREYYFKITVDCSSYDFQVTGIKVEGDKLKITAKEVGYWASKLDHKGVDLRTVIGSDVVYVTDDNEKKEINTRSCWC
jgi:hypothetical protein